MYETRSFREYVTESLRLQAENKYLSVSWIDAIRKKQEDSRTPEEIAADIIKRAGLTLQDGGED